MSHSICQPQNEDDRRAVSNSYRVPFPSPKFLCYLPDFPPNVPDGGSRSDMNVTSVDSGVETGNDSNDSSTVQHDSQTTVASTVAVTTAIAIATDTASRAADDSVAASFTGDDDTVDIATYVSRRPEEFSLDKIRYNPIIPILNKLSPMTCGIETGYNDNNQVSSTREPADRVSDKRKLLFSKYSFYPLDMPVCGTSKMIRKLHLDGDSIYRNKLSKFRRRNYGAWESWQNSHAERRMRLAAASNNIEMMKRLLGLGTSPNNHDEHGRSPLHHAACRGYTEMVQLLLEHGADPNQRDCIGNTPLHLAAVTSKISVVTLLLTAGTDVLSSDQHGYNPLQLAQTKLKMLQTYNDKDMVKIKEEMHSIVNMLLVYLKKQRNMREQVETLSNFCSRLSLSNTTDQVQDDVKDLLANIETLSITS